LKTLPPLSSRREEWGRCHRKVTVGADGRICCGVGGVKIKIPSSVTALQAVPASPPHKGKPRAGVGGCVRNDVEYRLCPYRLAAERQETSSLFRGDSSVATIPWLAPKPYGQNDVGEARIRNWGGDVLFEKRFAMTQNTGMGGMYVVLRGKSLYTINKKRSGCPLLFYVISISCVLSNNYNKYRQDSMPPWMDRLNR
jgi:hypothetical protein